MALEPAISVLLGLPMLYQKPSTLQLVGILLVSSPVQPHNPLADGTRVGDDDRRPHAS